MPEPYALAGLKVLDFTHALAGPYCTMILAEYGADVYKLESPTTGGDMGRGWGPPFVGTEAAYFLGVNRGKRALALDLKSPRGLELCLRLIDQVDIVIENFRPGTMDRLGLGYEAVHARNPRVIYCSISGYGQNGPCRDDAAMDLVVQASSGLISITGTESGEVVRCGYSVADATAGMFAIIGILTALRAREQSGKGQLVDVSMFDGMISAMTSNYSTFLGSRVPPRPRGTAFTTIVPYRVYPCKDRGIAIAVASEKLWRAFCQAIEQPDLLSDPRYETNATRVAHREVLEPFLDEVFATRTAAEWSARFAPHGIPCSPVQDMAEVFAHPQAAARGMFPELDHPSAGRHPVTGSPFKLSESAVGRTEPAPLMGQHTRQAVQELLGLQPAEIDSLIDAKVLFE